MTLISPGDCTLRCAMWLWNHDSEFTKWQHPAIWYVALGWHMPLNSPAGSTPQNVTRSCAWDHYTDFARWQHTTMWQVGLGWYRRLNSPKRLPYWNSTIWFRFRPYHRSRHVILHQSAKCYPIGPPSAKNDFMSIFKMADLSHLGF